MFHFRREGAIVKVTVPPPGILEQPLQALYSHLRRPGFAAIENSQRMCHEKSLRAGLGARANTHTTCTPPAVTSSEISDSETEIPLLDSCLRTPELSVTDRRLESLPLESTMKITCVAVLDDNFAYLLTDEAGVTAAIDPAEADKVQPRPILSEGWDRKGLLTAVVFNMIFRPTTSHRNTVSRFGPRARARPCGRKV